MSERVLLQREAAAARGAVGAGAAATGAQVCGNSVRGHGKALRSGLVLAAPVRPGISGCRGGAIAPKRLRPGCRKLTLPRSINRGLGDGLDVKNRRRHHLYVPYPAWLSAAATREPFCYPRLNSAAVLLCCVLVLKTICPAFRAFEKYFQSKPNALKLWRSGLLLFCYI